MATWDGSYSEDPNYFAYSDQNAPSVTGGNWPYFATNVTYPQEVSVENYSRTSGQRVCEQRSTATLHQVGTQQFPLTSNMLPLENTFQEQILPNTTLMDNAQVPNDLQDSTSNISQNISPFFHYNYRSRYKTNRVTDKHLQSSKSNSVHSIVVENSNLHPTASEFVPNNVKFKKDKFNKKKYQNDTMDRSSYNVDAQNFKSTSFMNSSLPNNRYRNERQHYDSRKGMNYKQKNSQNTQVSSSSNYRDAHKIYNARNNYKFQNGKYYNKKQQSNASSTEEHAFGKALLSRTESTALSKSNNFEIQEDDDSSIMIGTRREETSTREDSLQNMLLKNDKQQNNNKFNRFTSYANTSNYHKYNSGNVQFESGVKYKTTRYTQRRNNEVISHREKKLENWRDKIDNTKAHMQEKHLKKKGEIGMLQFIKKNLYCKHNFKYRLHMKKFCFIYVWQIAMPLKERD